MANAMSKEAINSEVTRINEAIEQEKQRARDMFETILEANNGSWKTYKDSGLSEENSGPFAKIRQLIKERKEVEAKDPELAKKAKKEALLKQLAALEAEENGEGETEDQQ